jgi:hypothetical protein
MSGSRRSPWSAPATSIPDRAGGSGSSGSNNGNTAYTALSNNTGTVLRTRVNGPATTVSVAVTLTPKVSGHFVVSGFMGLINGTASQSCAFSLSDGTTTFTGVQIGDTAGNTNIAFPGIDFAGYPIGTPVTWTLSATAVGNLTTTATKDDVCAFELPT